MKTSNLLLILAAFIFMGFSYFNVKDHTKYPIIIVGNKAIETRSYPEFNTSMFLLGSKQDLTLDPSFSGIKLTTDQNILDEIERFGIQKFFSYYSTDSINQHYLGNQKQHEVKYSEWMYATLGTKLLDTLNIQSNVLFSQDRPSHIRTVDTVRFDHLNLASTWQVSVDGVFDVNTILYNLAPASKYNKIAGNVNNLDIYMWGFSKLDAKSLIVNSNLNFNTMDKDTLLINGNYINGVIDGGSVVQNKVNARQLIINRINGTYTEPE